MKSAASLKLTVNESHLKLVRNTAKDQISKIYINTL